MPNSIIAFQCVRTHHWLQGLVLFSSSFLDASSHIYKRVYSSVDLSFAARGAEALGPEAFEGLGSAGLEPWEMGRMDVALRVRCLTRPVHMFRRILASLCEGVSVGRLVDWLS